MINYHVKNTRTGLTVRTFGDPKTATDWAVAHSDALGSLAAYAVETITRERLLTAEPQATTIRTLRRAS